MPPSHTHLPEWLFAYGSLMWRPGFEHEGRQRGYVRGWTRRFWQGSPDHRGVPEAPGRVVTLLPEPEARCWGLAYRLPRSGTSQLLAALDHRERGGYQRRRLAFFSDEPEPIHCEVLSYVAPANNEHFAGPAPLDELVRQVRRSHGPSGSNVDYVMGLQAALERLGVDDPHVSELARELAAATTRRPHAGAATGRSDED